MMILKHAKKAVDSYLNLVREFPLVAIRSEGEYDAAVEVMIPLTARDNQLDKGEREYLQTLAVLVGEYEREHYRIKAKLLEPVALLKFLMHENSMTVNDLGEVIGSQSAASMILNGKREISKEHAKKIAARFKLEIGTFIV